VTPKLEISVPGLARLQAVLTIFQFRRLKDTYGIMLYNRDFGKLFL
jgi:hypothetical protein